MSPSTETLPQYDLERGQGVEIGLSQINNANLCPPPLYLKRCPVLHSPPSYKSQDQGELEAQTGKLKSYENHMGSVHVHA